MVWLVRADLIASAFIGLLVISLFFVSYVEAASYPDLSVVSVAPHDAYAPSKYVSGYRVVVANYGSAPSPSTVMNFYVRTYDGKILNRNFTVPSIAPGCAKGLKFSMCNGTDGSFKNGYVVVNKNMAFRELNYRNNARNFGLKETILSSSNKTVSETYSTTQLSSQTWSGTTYNYTSPLSGKTGITQMTARISTGGLRGVYGAKVTADIPGYMHDNVTINIGGYGSGYKPTSWNDTSIVFEKTAYMSSYNYAEIVVSGENLESKHVFKEPIKIYRCAFVNPNFVFYEVGSGNIREVQESYSALLVSSNTKNYVGTNVLNYQVHNSNVTSLKVLGDPRKLYVAGWFIQPKGNVSSVTALYGSNSAPASYVTSGYWGVRHYFNGLNSVGFQINGTNLTGFSNFKTYGFSTWTWRDQY